MTVGIALNNSTVMAGINTGSFTVVTAGAYVCEFKSFIPYKASGMPGGSDVTTGASGLSVVVNLNGSPVLTVDTPAPNQPLMGGKVAMLCVATDVITVVLTSSAAADNQPNAVKTVINLYQGVV